MRRWRAVQADRPENSHKEPGEDWKAAGRRGGTTVRFRYIWQKNA
ncbi:hypothetical protein [Methanoculleus chikugoensis]|nr:hypothetical protein [Methanoculleus chikugoensis]